MTNGLIITEIDSDSVGKEIGLQAGDILIGFNGQKVEDMLDYSYYDCMERFTLNVMRKARQLDFYVEKEDWEPLGLNFADECYLTPKSCRNKCIFCFVDQLPSGMRDTLYVKDDDYRLSFVSGNFVTMTNVSEDDINRIIRMKLSPLYVSVHATDEEVRLYMLGVKKAPPIMPMLKRLTDAGIEINTQIVVCPEINDGSVLKKSLNDLYGLYPKIKSVAIVPVGLTAHRVKNDLRLNTKDEALALIDLVESFNRGLKSSKGFAFCSDELYVAAQICEPPYEYYGDFDQIENGVGLLAKFRHEFHEALDYAVRPAKGGFTLVTGVSAYGFMIDLAEGLKKKFAKADIEVVKIVNNFFGESVTVAGLLTGKDIIEQLKDKKLKENLVLPEVMLKEFDRVFLDGATPEDIEKSLNVNVIVTEANGYSLVEALTESE